MNNTVWIGLVGFEPVKKNTIIGQSKGAYTIILAFASSRRNYEEKVSEFLIQNSLKLIEIEDLEPFEERIAKYVVEQYLIDLAKIVSECGEIRYGTLHIF
jgi:hypothetical protein